MIRIELDRIHLELLLLAGLLAAFAGVVFEPTMWYGVNATPLVALGVVGMIGLLVLVHRRFTTGDRSRVRAMVWLALVGALLGATVSTVVVGDVESMALAAAGVGAMFFAIGTQFSIVVKTRETAAREAVEEILDEENVFVASEQLQMNSTDADGQRSSFEPTAETESTTPSATANSESETGSDTTETTSWSETAAVADEPEGEDETEGKTDEATESDSEKTDDSSDDSHDIEQTDGPGSESWAQSTTDDTGPIPVIRSITPSESSEE